MVPAAFVILPSLPLSHHGKVDRAALPAPLPAASGHEAVAPRTPVETALAGIWSRVLGRGPVGIHDNFFELGGDSILCVQVISRARQAGFRLTPKDLFQHQTIAELAAAAGGTDAQTSGGDEIPLTPIQRWFFDLDLQDPHHFNQSLLLDLRQEIEPASLQRALDQTVERHLALRCRFLRDELGGWRQIEVKTALPLSRVDLSALSRPLSRGALERAAGVLQESLDLERGPLLRTALFTLEDGQRLLFAVHHLIVDAVSWRVLVADLEAACRAFAESREATLPPPGASFRQGSMALSEQARSTAIAAELGYWLEPSRARVRPLPVDRSGGANTVASAHTIVVELEAAETGALLTEVPQAYRTRITDALLTALLQAFADWTGEPRLLVDIEGHGREALPPGLEISRTVGWFTSLYPVLIELDRKQRHPGERLKAVKERLWSVPRGGAGYGLLRYLGEGTAPDRLREMPAAEVLFNYLGELDQGLAQDSLFGRAPEPAGPGRSPRQRRSHLLEINGGLIGGRLRVLWTYSEDLHNRQTIQSLADRFTASLRELIEHCRATAAGGFTPADFPEARVSQRDLDKLMARIGKRGPLVR
jgi:non-ribosomal peptide synthase protein (TIGR01720 family)